MSQVKAELSSLTLKRAGKAIDAYAAAKEKRMAIEAGAPGSLEDAKKAEASAKHRDDVMRISMEHTLGDGLVITEDDASCGEYSGMDWSDVLPDLTAPLARPDFW